MWERNGWLTGNSDTFNYTDNLDPESRLSVYAIQRRGIYSTMASDSILHPLSLSTILDSGGAMHLVNDISLLDRQEYTLSPVSDYIESGTTRFQIVGRRTRTIKSVMIRPGGAEKGNLILKNMAYIPGFHINIVSETKLRDTGLWFLGLDSILRYRTLQSNSIVIQCIRRDNLLFLEYKPLSFYSLALLNVLANRSILMYPTINKKINKSFQQSYNPSKP